MSWQLRIPVLLSIAAALVTIGLKFFAYAITGSVGLFSDAIESLVNLLAASTAMYCLWYASQPADANHAYGHEKIEYFSSGLEGALILAAAAGIAWSAVDRLFHPQPLESIGLGVAISLAAAGVNLAVALMLLRVGRKHQSIILEADGHHLMSDVWTSVGVAVALGLATWTGLEILDPLIAIVVAGNVAWTAVSLIRRSFDGLMDHALPEHEQHLVRTILNTHMRPGLHYHAFRSRRAGARRFIDFHLLVPGAWTVAQTHEFADGVEKEVKDALPGVEITTHFEPIEDEASWRDSELLAVEPKPTAHE